MMDGIDLNLSKKDLQALGKLRAEELIEAGYTDPLESFAKCKQLIELLTSFSTAMGAYAQDELDKHGEKKAFVGNVRLELGNTGDRYDYERDPVYAELKAQMADRKKILDAARTATQDYHVYKDVPRVPLKTPGKQIIKATIT